MTLKGQPGGMALPKRERRAWNTSSACAVFMHDQFNTLSLIFGGLSSIRTEITTELYFSHLDVLVTVKSVPSHCTEMQTRCKIKFFRSTITLGNARAWRRSTNQNNMCNVRSEDSEVLKLLPIDEVPCTINKSLRPR